MTAQVVNSLGMARQGLSSRCSQGWPRAAAQPAQVWGAALAPVPGAQGRLSQGPPTGSSPIQMAAEPAGFWLFQEADVIKAQMTEV